MSALRSIGCNMLADRARISKTDVVAIAFQQDGQGSGSPISPTGVAIGAASGDRVVVVGVYGKGSSISVNSVTIGGVSATKIIDVTYNEGDASLWALNVTSGTTANIVITSTGTVDRLFWGVWAMTGTGGSVTASGTDTDTGASTNLSTTVTVSATGGAIAVHGQNGIAAITMGGDLTQDWTETDGIGEGYGGSIDDTTAGSKSATTALNTSHEAAVMAAWG